MLSRTFNKASSTAAAGEVTGSVNLQAIKKAHRPGHYTVCGNTFALGGYHAAAEPNYRKRPYKWAAYSAENMDPWAPFQFTTPVRHYSHEAEGAWWAYGVVGSGHKCPQKDREWFGIGGWRFHLHRRIPAIIGFSYAFFFYWYNMGFRNKWLVQNKSGTVGNPSG